MNANLRNQLTQISKDMRQFSLFEDEVVGTTDTTEVLHPNPKVNKMLLANRAKREKLKALGLKETHKRKLKKSKSVVPNNQAAQTLSPLQERVIDEAATTLKNLGCSYRITFGGKEWTDGEVVANKTRGPDYGDRSHYIMQYIKGLELGKLVEIPLNGFDANKLQSTIAARCNMEYGAHHVATHINHDKDCIEVLRKR